MLIRVGDSGFALLLIMLARSPAVHNEEQKLPWKGYSILGNGHLTAVNSDDSRITGATNAEGIQHSYFINYTADFITSTSLNRLSGTKGRWNPRKERSKPIKSISLTSLKESGGVVIALSRMEPRWQSLESRRFILL